MKRGRLKGVKLRRNNAKKKSFNAKIRQEGMKRKQKKKSIKK